MTKKGGSSGLAWGFGHFWTPKRVKKGVKNAFLGGLRKPEKSCHICRAFLAKPSNRRGRFWGVFGGVFGPPFPHLAAPKRVFLTVLGCFPDLDVFCRGFFCPVLAKSPGRPILTKKGLFWPFFGSFLGPFLEIIAALLGPKTRFGTKFCVFAWRTSHFPVLTGAARLIL